MAGVAAVGIAGFAPEGGDFDLDRGLAFGRSVFDDQDHPEGGADRDRTRKCTLDLGRVRGGCDVKILGDTPEETVTHAAAGK
ncbi:MAG: hypothetical protein AMXMBFR7_29840 [Planctomycetota bacterium]